MNLRLQVELEGGVPGGVWGLCLSAGGVPGVWGWAGVLFVPSPSVTMTMTMTTDPYLARLLFTELALTLLFAD